MLDALAAYRKDNNDTEFKYLHVFKRIENCEKWRQTRRTLGNDGEYDPQAAAPAAGDGRPIGNNAAKTARNAAPAAEKMHTMLEKCLTDAATLSATRDAQFADRWSAVMAKQDVKIGLVKTKVAAKKRTQDMAFLMTGTARSEERRVGKECRL